MACARRHGYRRLLLLARVHASQPARAHGAGSGGNGLFPVHVSAAQAMLTAVAQARRMSGTLSATSLSGIFVPIVLAAVAGGWIVTHLSARGTFVAAASTTLVVLFQMTVSSILKTPFGPIRTRNAASQRSSESPLTARSGRPL